MKKIFLLAIIAAWAIVLVFDLNYSLGITITLFLGALLAFYVLSNKKVIKSEKKEEHAHEEPKVLIWKAKNPNSVNLTDGNEYTVIAINKGRALVKNDKGRKEWYSIMANFARK